ncbi:uncharacterized protein LOC116848043 isoform X1 [Odontomachus brunneus]|uniref:uncharacterized protein LOC116848043 isoform X1 n=1 Tax=Odontomachus brunneus TaxID=486640 RepID=UPI0013F2A6D4|nr:uncharacterized protein LOC116848043 isoform X1 [Odontomachus brunneus]
MVHLHTCIFYIESLVKCSHLKTKTIRTTRTTCPCMRTFILCVEERLTSFRSRIDRALRNILYSIRNCGLPARRKTHLVGKVQRTFRISQLCTHGSGVVISDVSLARDDESISGFSCSADLSVAVSRGERCDHNRLGYLSRTPNRIDMGHVATHGSRGESDKVFDDGYLAVHKEVLRMLTPRRAGPVGPEEIGPDDKGVSNAASGSVTPGGSYESGDGSKEFLSTGRTGRRNALPNILGRHAETGLSDLPDRFDALSTHSDQSNNSGQDPNIPGTSKQHG